MHHANRVFGINFLIHFVNLISLVLVHLVHLSAHPHHSQHPFFLQSFTRPRLLPPTSGRKCHLDCLHGLCTRPDLSCSSVSFLFILSLIFCLVLCGRLSRLPSVFHCPWIYGDSPGVPDSNRIYRRSIVSYCKDRDEMRRSESTASRLIC